MQRAAVQNLRAFADDDVEGFEHVNPREPERLGAVFTGDDAPAAVESLEVSDWRAGEPAAVASWVAVKTRAYGRRMDDEPAPVSERLCIHDHIGVGVGIRRLEECRFEGPSIGRDPSDPTRRRDDGRRSHWSVRLLGRRARDDQ